MKRLLFAALFICTVPLLGEAADTRYKIVNGKVLAPAKATDGTILLDETSGRTWILLQRGATTPVWFPIPFESTPQLSFQLVPGPAPSQRSEARGDN